MHRTFDVRDTHAIKCIQTNEIIQSEWGERKADHACYVLNQHNEKNGHEDRYVVVLNKDCDSFRPLIKAAEKAGIDLTSLF